MPKIVSIAFALLVTAGCGPSKTPVASYEDKIADARAEANPDSRARKLIVLGYQQASKSQDIIGSNKTLEWAESSCEEITDPSAKAGAYTLLGGAQARLGSKVKAGKALKEARTAADGIENMEVRIGALAGIAAVYGSHLKETEKANEVLKTAADAASKIEDPQSRAIALKDVAKAYFKSELKEAGDKSLASAIEAAGAVEDAKMRSDVIAQIAAAQAASDSEAALATFESALESARKADKAYSQAYALTEIAEKLAEAKHVDLARKTLDEAKALVKDIPEVDLQGQTEAKISKVKSKLP